jgi:hypothetical protein
MRRPGCESAGEPARSRRKKNETRFRCWQKTTIVPKLLANLTQAQACQAGTSPSGHMGGYG